MFILYNNQLKRPLLHPQVGLWCTPDKSEADDLLESCHEYVRSLGLDDLIPNLIVKEISEINPSLQPS